jgi:hypothetical protein
MKSSKMRFFLQLPHVASWISRDSFQGSILHYFPFKLTLMTQLILVTRLKGSGAHLEKIYHDAPVFIIVN